MQGRPQQQAKGNAWLRHGLARAHQNRSAFRPSQCLGAEMVPQALLSPQAGGGRGATSAQPPACRLLVATGPQPCRLSWVLQEGHPLPGVSIQVVSPLLRWQYWERMDGCSCAVYHRRAAEQCHGWWRTVGFFMQEKVLCQQSSRVTQLMNNAFYHP